MGGFYLGDLLYVSKGKMGGPISFKHAGNEAPSKKVATSLSFQVGKVFELWSMWGVGLREKNEGDQLEREVFKNSYF